MNPWHEWLYFWFFVALAAYGLGGWLCLAAVLAGEELRDGLRAWLGRY